jgi:hypothetical protein
MNAAMSSKTAGSRCAVPVLGRPLPASAISNVLRAHFNTAGRYILFHGSGAMSRSVTSDGAVVPGDLPGERAFAAMQRARSVRARDSGASVADRDGRGEGRRIASHHAKVTWTLVIVYHAEIHRSSGVGRLETVGGIPSRRRKISTR